jgi:hypothetical protein
MEGMSFRRHSPVPFSKTKKPFLEDGEKPTTIFV